MVAVKRGFVPDRGDIVWLEFNPTRGHEQNGRRPALVVSSRLYNSRSGLALVCPITSRIKGYPFEIPFKAKNSKGAILADQIRSIDWRERKAIKADKASSATTTELLECIRTLLNS